jgi:hypothetical protein
MLPSTSQETNIRETAKEPISHKPLRQGEAIRQHTMRQERDTFEDRFANAEAEIRRLTNAFSDLRNQWDKEREHDSGSLREDYETLKKAVLDYVIAYGAVDVQVALLRARGDVDGDVYDILRRSLEEQANALHALRTLARNLQQGDRPGRD